MFRQAETVLNRLEKEYPDARTQLHYNDLFELLVAVVLSAQSTDKQVNRVTPGLFARYPDAAAMAQAEINDLEDLIKGVGLYHSKARHLKQTAKILVSQYEGQVPDSFEQLLELPGVGRKTANVIIAVGFDGPGLGVDTHVHRVANRLGLVNSRDRNRTEKDLKAIISQERWNRAHHLFIWHGRQVCRARRPDCEQCIVQDQCQFNQQQSKV
jgi:endonuclease-3